MKKLLAILLIGAIACTVVEDTDLNDVVLKNIFDDIGKEIEKGAKEAQKGVENGVKEVKKGVENGAKEVQKGVENVSKEVEKGLKGIEKVANKLLKGASKAVKVAVQYLKEHGYWEKVLKGLKEAGKWTAKAICTHYAGPTVGHYCETAVEFLANKFIKQ